MMATRHLTTFMAALLVACVAAAQQPKRQVDDWNVTNGTIAVENYQGKEAFHLVSSKTLTLARRRGMSFRDGTIELDIAAAAKGDHYIGVAFRMQDKVAKALKVQDNSKQLFENIYFRPFKSGTENAIQYCAAGTKCNWSYLRKNYPGVYEANADLPETGWFHVKIVIARVTAKVYVNDATTPNLVVKDLKHGFSEGGVGLTTYHKSAYFANLKVTPADADPGRNPRRCRLLFTRAHGEWKPPSRLAKLAERIGLDVVTSDEAITPNTLRSADVLFIFMPTKPFTDGERNAVAGFVKGGGSLLLVLDEEQRQSLKKTGVNGLIAPFGMALTEDTPYLHNRGAIAQKGVVNAGAREVPYSGGRAVRGGTPFSFILDREGRATELAHGAYTVTPKGSRIIVLGEGMAFLFMGGKTGVRLTGTKPRDTNYWGKDSSVFNREILEWLTAPR